MKNYIPVVLAVLMGLAAVLAVSRMLNKNQVAPEEEDQVVAALRDLKAGDTVQVDALQKKVIPVSARPADAVVWSKRSLVVGQVLNRPVRAGDYLLSTYMSLSRSMSSLVGEGEWAVTIPGGGAGIGKSVQPGDEVAVIATFMLEMNLPNLDSSQSAQRVGKDVTLVLFPRVRVLENSAGGRNEEGGGDIVLALPPQQAQVLIAAQRKAQLTLALRRPGDSAALSRSAAGLVDEETFRKLLNEVKPVVVPDAPEVKSR